MSSPEATVADTISWHTLAEEVVVHPLEALVPVRAPLRDLLRQAAIRTFDAQVLIEDPLTAPRRRPAVAAQKIDTALPPLALVESTLAHIEQHGLYGNLRRLVDSFGVLLLWLRGSDFHREKIIDWTENKKLDGAFFMTDRGGPSMRHDWKTTWEVDGDHGTLTIDKISAIGAMDFGFAWVAARSPKSLGPALVLVDPESAASLKRTASGLPYLDGSLQLGNVSGTLRLPTTHVIEKGGVAGVKQFLSIVRPRFVTAICAHLLWLQRRDGLTLDATRLDALRNIQQIARALIDQAPGAGEDAVLLMKFAINELLVDLVCAGAVARPMDQRDLLGLSKMEGSSYRCMLEVLSRMRSYVKNS